MNINVSLSTQSINSAIRIFQDLADNLDIGVDHVVDILTNEGAEIARTAYGEYPVVTTAIPEGKTGEIVVAGDMPLIAEFGAGDATVSGGFENTPAEARPGSYSELHAQQYSRYGFWYFGGERYTEVPARQGLLAAKQYIMENGTQVVTEVIGL